MASFWLKSSQRFVLSLQYFLPIHGKAVENVENQHLELKHKRHLLRFYHFPFLLVVEGLYFVKHLKAYTFFQFNLSLIF